jgi:hypothetical protein
LGTAYAKQDKKDLAREAFKKVLALESKGPDADKAREWLKELGPSSPPDDKATVPCPNPKCGKPTDAAGKFCKHCGTALTPAPTETESKNESSGARLYLPMTAGNRWVYASSTQTFIVADGRRIPVQDTKGTLTDEIVGPSEQVTTPAGVMARRSTLSERGMLDGQFNEINMVQTSHVGWVGDWLSLFQEEVIGDATQEPSAEVYSPPLRFLKKTLNVGDTWNVGIERQEGLTLPTRARVLELEDVAVPAGTFKQCLKLMNEVVEPRGRIKNEGLELNVTRGRIVETLWFAAGVGVVKAELTATMTLDLMGVAIEMQRTHTLVLQPGYRVVK